MSEQLFIEHYKNTDVEADNIIKAQRIAQDCLEYLKTFLRPGMTYEEIHEACKDRMLAKGAERFWTHEDPALILFGDMSTYSAHEAPDLKKMIVQENDFITVDVAPVMGNGWGDMARSYVMEKGKTIRYVDSDNQEIKEGLDFELYLHQEFIQFVNEETTFSGLHDYIEDLLKKHHYINLDYHGNFGHTIEKDPKDRVTIIHGEDRKISEYNKPITFEPHICRVNGRYGIKHENMYFFHEGKILEVL